MSGLVTVLLHLLYVLKNLGCINIDDLPFLGWMAYGTLSCLAKRAHKLDYVDHPIDRVYACEAGFVAIDHGDGHGKYSSTVRRHPWATVIWYKDLWIAKRAQASRKYYIPPPKDHRYNPGVTNTILTLCSRFLFHLGTFGAAVPARSTITILLGVATNNL